MTDTRRGTGIGCIKMKKKHHGETDDQKFGLLYGTPKVLGTLYCLLELLEVGWGLSEGRSLRFSRKVCFREERRKSEGELSLVLSVFD